MRARTIAWTLLLFASVAGASTLEEAFRREQAMLEAERTALQATLAEDRERVRGREAALRRLLATATDSVNALEMDIAALRRELNAAVQSPGSVGVDAAVANATLALRDLGITLPAGPDSTVSARVTGLVERSLEVLRSASSLHVTDGTFFDVAGREQEGAIVHVGRVARLGSAPGAGGVLAPAGGGAWRVVDPGGAPVARAIREGEAVSSVPVFLTDPLLGEAESTRERTLGDLLAAGGLIVWPILALAFVAIVIVVDRAVRVLQARRNAHAFAAWGERDTTDAPPDWNALTAQCAATPGPMARVMESAMSNRHASPDVLEGVIDEAVLSETERLDRFLPSLRAIAAVAPLLGLLGTVTGMIRTFDVITDFGTGNPKLLSGGISEALITTEVGLAVAIPTLLIYSVLAGAVDGVSSDMERRALRLGLALRRATPRDGSG